MSANGGALGPMVHARVHVLTNDGRHVVGTLRGFDQVTNVILEDCAERVYSSESGVEEAPLGVYMIRGDNVALVGPVDEELDAKLDLSGTRALPLKPIKF
ncbi:Ribonucleoprotein LSM domain,eukaryotic/archaea-type [Ostreococcus tauri]|uniref:U6 snRNA-associated Sm-like protein LSm8 n=1 Tax=Ostreococcus tauri TaxID=70448 RepID=A0A090MEE4_OSTTA|nr:Ribonucleoprotein LSM domain,eukaryotic/archaea-type [Ostreococcus tauri]CEG01322.1 Ribonucleoprotein LSM domain,eukaryotic/archaea-type [Ostreococcus tauri]|eukprot:XP_022840889.1 Ribonucleoprotein LSM domain,eukaryotic/archaea-type [Ostreococcus tauri]